MVANTLLRLIWVPIVFLISAIVAVFVLMSLGLEQITHQMRDLQADEQGALVIFSFVSQGLLLTTGLTLVPAILVVIVGEVARLRSALYYTIGGGLALVAIPLLARLAQTDAAAATGPLFWQVFATAGFAGGFVYWLLAGRHA